MLAADTNVWIALFAQDNAEDIRAFRHLLSRDRVLMPPVVLSEILSDPAFPPEQRPFLNGAQVMDIIPGYWERAGLVRAELIRKGYRPRLPDTLIAQSCLDHNVPLLTRDGGFDGFEKYCGLRLHRPA